MSLGAEERLDHGGELVRDDPGAVDLRSRPRPLRVAEGLDEADAFTPLDDRHHQQRAVAEREQQLVSHNAATVFGVALLASGFASSSVGTMAGQVVMQGFIQRRIPIFLRRAITLAPALIVLAIGLNPTDALVMSQVVLSFGIPFALVPLLLIARRRDVMGPLANPPWLSALAGTLAGMIIALNVFLLQRVFFG